MTILIFLIILGVLVFIHELGHFLAAKKAGVRVEEFGFGYPPRALKLGKKWGTVFTLNWIPFGGFVKIVEENYEEGTSPSPLLAQDAEGAGFPSPDQGEGGRRLGGVSFTQVSRKWQAVILAAGVTFNIIFAWLLFSLSFMIGLPAAAENDYGAVVKNPALTIVDIIPDSPAETSGLKAGDRIQEISLPGGETLIDADLTSEAVSDFVNRTSSQIKMEINRGGETLNFEITPEAGIVEDRKVIGIDMETVGTVTLPVHKAFYEGAKTTYRITSGTVVGITTLITDAFRGEGDISNIAGPVGIVSLVGDASRLGFVYLLTFTALISINLAIINLVPFPALDGGRILFVAIEGLTKKPINPKIAGTVNTVGFALLILLMLFVTYRDILRLF